MQTIGDNRLAVLAGEIITAVGEIRTGAQAIAERAIRVGRHLIEAKAALPHGQWEPWLAEHVSMSPRTARRYMSLAASGMETATVADLGIRAAAERLSRPRQPNRPGQPAAEELARSILKNMTQAEVGRIASWLERAAEQRPEQAVAQVMAADVSVGWLNKSWAAEREPARRRFVEWLRDRKQEEAA